MKTLAVFLFIVASVFAAGKPESDRIRLGASLLTGSHPFYQSIRTALEQEAEMQNVDLSVAVADQDLNRQISAVEDFINKNVDVIIITPVDSDGVKGAIIKAERANIPVITVDIGANDVEVASHIATDNYSGGKLAGEAMAKILNYTGKVALMTYPEVQSVRDRIDGFKEQVAQYEGIEIVVELPGRTRAEAKTTAENMVTAQPELRGIFGFGDDMALAATSVVEERNLDIVVIGFDGLEEARKAVDEDNAFQAVVTQAPEEMGRTAVRLAVNLVNGETIEKFIPIVPGLYMHAQGNVAVSLNGDKISF